MVDIIEHDSYITNHELHGRVRETNLKRQMPRNHFCQRKKAFFWIFRRKRPLHHEGEESIIVTEGIYCYNQIKKRTLTFLETRKKVEFYFFRWVHC